MPDQTHDAGLHDRLRKGGVDRLGESLQSIDDGGQNILDAADLQFVNDAQPELGALGRLDPDAEDVLRAVGLNAQRQIDCLTSSRIFTRMASKKISG